MLRTVGEEPTLWESLLPAEALVMPAELVRVDVLLDDDRFFEPYGEFFHATLGRPSIPIETYLRLMFLKYRYRLGFETLCREGDRLDLAAVLSGPVGWAGAASDDVDEVTTRCGGRRGWVERVLARR
jgi:IS5 family transposase